MFLKISIYHQWNISRIYFLSKYIYISLRSNPVTCSKSKGLKFNVARYAKASKLCDCYSLPPRLEARRKKIQRRGKERGMENVRKGKKKGKKREGGR